MQKTVLRTCSNHWRRTPIPLSQQVRQRLHQPFEGLKEYDYRLGTSYRMAILSFLQDDAFIFVNALVAEQPVEVKSKLGFVANIIFSDVISLARNLISWQWTGEV